ncbi:MAG TPA: segregation/condensation protein A [Cyanothece sp. UBA12306]|nr:segregation/condensation protein A [Cyanothece sp. UBA12306]
MTTSSATEAIAVLIDLAQQGDIDPWNVQVIDIVDRFLDELGITQDLDLAYQTTNLPKSGQAFLWASMLVRFKADTLEKLDTEEEELLVTQEMVPDQKERSLPLKLEQQLRRRSVAPPRSQRRVTLSELITHIEAMAEELEQGKPASSRKRKPRNASRQEAMEIVTQLAHQENLTELAQQLEQFFTNQLSEFMPTQNWIQLEELLTWWHGVQSPHESEIKQDRVGVFWALLLLSSQSKVELSQEEFYQDLKIQVL